MWKRYSKFGENKLMNISHEQDEYGTHWDYGNSFKQHSFFAGEKKQTAEHLTPVSLEKTLVPISSMKTPYQCYENEDFGKEKRKAERNKAGEISKNQIAEPFPLGPKWPFLEKDFLLRSLPSELIKNKRCVHRPLIVGPKWGFSEDEFNLDNSETFEKIKELNWGPEMELEAYKSLRLGHRSDQTNQKKMIPANSLKTIEQRGLENVNYQKRIKEAKELEEKRITEVKEREAKRKEEIKKRKAKQIEEAKEREAKRIEKAKQREAKRIQEAIEMERKRMHLLASLGTHKPTQKQLSILNPIVFKPNTKASGKLPVVRLNMTQIKKLRDEKLQSSNLVNKGAKIVTNQAPGFRSFQDSRPSNTLHGSSVIMQRCNQGSNPNEEINKKKRKRDEVKKSNENKENISVSKKAKQLKRDSQEKMPLDKNQCPVCKQRLDVDKAEFQKHIFSCYKRDQ